MDLDSLLPRSRRTATLAIIALLGTIVVLLAPDGAGAKGKGGKGKGSMVPPNGKVYMGVSDTGQGSDYRAFRDKVGAHPAVMQSFESWGYIPKEAIGRWKESRTRGMLSLSTGRCWGCKPVISTKSIAKGKGDGYLLGLAKALDRYDEPTYIRLMPEMNGHWNAYSAFDANGDSRGKSNSTKTFKAAWKRIAVILKGGSRAKAERQLRKLGQPKIKAKTKKRLPTPKIALGWVPQSAGSPDVPGNQPADYFPGYAYVDWVGGDIYGKFPSLDGLDSLYRKYSKAPFMIGEWAPWGRDDPAFVRSLLNWIRTHKRVRMAVYYQGFGEGGVNEFELGDYPNATKVLAKQLQAGKRFPRFTPENAKKKGGGKPGGGKPGKPDKPGKKP